MGNFCLNILKSLVPYEFFVKLSYDIVKNVLFSRKILILRTPSAKIAHSYEGIREKALGVQSW